MSWENAVKPQHENTFTFYHNNDSSSDEDNVVEYNLEHPVWQTDTEKSEEEDSNEEEVEEAIEEVRENSRKSKYWDYFTDSSTTDSDNSEDERQEAEKKKQKELYEAAKVQKDPKSGPNIKYKLQLHPITNTYQEEESYSEHAKWTREYLAALKNSK